MKIAIAASLIASAAAFAPAAKQASTTAIKSFENELGVIVRYGKRRETSPSMELDRLL